MTAGEARIAGSTAASRCRSLTNDS